MSKEALRLWPFLFIVFTVLSTNCARQPTHNEGGQHTGGGVTESSKPEDVNSAVDLAIRLATQSDPAKNIFVQFWKARGASPNSLSGTRFFPNLNAKANERVRFESPVLQAFKHNPVEKLRTGDCPQSIPGKHADASVSALSLKATICFSTGNLSRLTPSVLVREVLSLLFHEAAHIGGAQEPEAIVWQTAFSSYFANRFGDVPSPNLVGDTFKGLSEIRVRLARAERLAAQNPMNNRIYGLLGNIAAQLMSLPYYKDPLAIRLKINPPHPEFIKIYSNSVSELVQMIQSKVEDHIIRMRPMSTSTSDDLPIKENEVSSLLSNVSHGLDVVTENFLAVVNGPSK